MQDTFQADPSEDYWELNPRLTKCCDAAFERLEAIDFEFDEDFKFAYLYAADTFNAATLWQVFALGQILKREQPITVRGAFYRAVSAGLYPDTSDNHYRACKTRILDMRRAGLVPYHYISDSTRRRLKPSSWSGLADFAESVVEAYRKNLWERQADYIEIFVEKDAMAGVIEPITNEFDLTLNVIRGNCSETFIYRVAELWKQISKPITIYYLGDHDPNGLGIENDLRERLEGFGAQIVHWQRLAVTEEDFDNPDYLGFPVKKNGAASYWQPYIDRYGDRCVEVDAISAGEIRERVREAIVSHIDKEEWEKLQQTEELEKATVLEILQGFGRTGTSE